MSDLADRGFMSLLDAMPDAIVCVERDGRIALANEGAERLFGYGRGELAGRPVEILLPDAARGAHPGHRACYAADPRPRQMGRGMEVAGRRRDGNTFPAEISLSSSGADEGILVLAAVRDLTERLDALARQERRRAVADARGVAHDISGLLGVISSYAGFVAEEMAKHATSDESWRSAVADIERVQLAAVRAANLTRQLMAHGRRAEAHPDVDETDALGHASLSASDPPQPAAERPSAEPEDTADQVVLVVEDEAALRELARRMLARNGYQVMVAADGQEAIDTATGSGLRVDALVTDLVMPGMPGEELADRIRELQPGIAVLYMSGYAAGRPTGQGVPDPAINLIGKPFTEATLLQSLRGVLRERDAP